MVAAFTLNSMQKDRERFDGIPAIVVNKDILCYNMFQQKENKMWPVNYTPIALLLNYRTRRKFAQSKLTYMVEVYGLD